MKSGWNLLSMAFLVFLLAIGTSQKTFAKQEQKQQAQKELTPEEQEKAALEKVRSSIAALLAQTNSAINSDIAKAKAKIQKMNDVKSQGNEIRQMLLIVTGRMSTYTTASFNLYVAALQDEPSAFPYILTATDDDDAPPEVPWFEFMKDPANTPAFNKPLDLVETIGSRFGKIAAKAQTLVSPMAQVIFDEVIKEQNENPNLVAPSQSPNHSIPRPYNIYDPNIIKTKSILKNLREKQTST